MKALIGKISAITGLALLPSLAITVPTEWSAKNTVQNIFTDNCGGTPVTAVSLNGDGKAYYFPVSSPASAHWLSELESAMATGTQVQIKFESASSYPGACGFNPGYLISVVSIMP